MNLDGQTYESLTANFAWQIPARYNIGVDVCDKWADGSGRLALIYEDPESNATRYTFDELKALSDRFANALLAAGAQRGDRIGIFLSQSVETAIAHLAAYKAGMVAVPLFALFGVDAIEHRLGDSGAVALITDHGGVQKVGEIRAALPSLRNVFSVDIDQDNGDPHAPVRSFWHALRSAPAGFMPADTGADDPAVIIYTSGTTGKPKGALHGHRVLPGHLPGVEMSQQGFPAHATLIWTPADWAWIGGLFDVLLPSWHHGVPVLARRFAKFDGEAAFDLMARHAVSHTFLPPTALKMMRGVERPERWSLALRSVASGGESLGEELIGWGRKALGVTINEFYGQTECNVVVSSCAALFEPRFGAIGRAVPGHRVAIVDMDGNELPPGAIGDIAVAAPDPVMFLGYWGNEAATREKFRGKFLVTGDLGTCDADGFIRFVGRGDDVITSAGYRIGPASIEDSLLRHPAVSMAAVIGAPDRERTEIVMAFVVLNPGFVGDAALVREIQQHVKTRLAAHEYPREIRFVDSLPLTATGKVIRKALREGLEQDADNPTSKPERR
ncbi:acyl-CoA synthetase/AMP-acid ligase [Burkholderia sp. Ch1-1]|uniref:Acyl-CoA synthetase/AMP-acid ligase n=1 Tax=Paraburkholderia dioscoreae TaxID=2604047 RepID=A0A5Q4Z7D6_9BURK|nr:MULTISPECIES: acyl-CoA synthetase [Paraburkholderia]EIF30412.1 acyl-CoA synthetase/AMP-acid ligase [Burkholderia sp. Ch1-1]MDR8395160.1 acyl-CoA synthetase [Paraburkholderia sp. USG1]VVD29495.1 Acyl-CoA synthetase/AMP-acid ligase [Paraburkholderia dioscoreae]